MNHDQQERPVTTPTSGSNRDLLIRSLLDDYLAMYAGRDPRLIERFSDNFSGYTGGGDFLVKDLRAWQDITRQDFTQVPRACHQSNPIL